MTGQEKGGETKTEYKNVFGKVEGKEKKKSGNTCIIE